MMLILSESTKPYANIIKCESDPQFNAD
jgi:hypothetical protein